MHSTQSLQEILNLVTENWRSIVHSEPPT